MAEPMSATNPFLNFPFGSIQMECEARDLIVEGEIPADLCGTLYRAGPNQRFKPRGDYHLFMGDGMVHAFHIKDGRVDYNNRWVRTNKWKHEDREGRALINPMNPFDCDPEYTDFVFTDKDGTANTAIVWHGGRLLVMEEGHPPFELDPHTLESIGSWNFRGKLNTAMTAHPKIDPDTGEMVFFAYMATGPFSADVMVHKVNPEGILTESTLIPTPYSAMVHDFVMTENYIIIPVMPITGSLERAMEGGPPFAWEPDKGVFLGVLPRHGGKTEDVRWIEMDLGFAFHFMNAFDQDGVISIDACQFESAPLFPTANAIAVADVSVLDMPKARARAIIGFAQAVASGELDLYRRDSLDQARSLLQAYPGIGPWSADLIAARAMDHTDAFPASDLGLRKSAALAFGHEAMVSARQLQQLSLAWQPWRTTAIAYLWMYPSSDAKVISGSKL